MKTVISEHSVDLNLLPPQSSILDLGCRGFMFTHAMRNKGHHVWPVDMDHLAEGQAYYQAAVSNKDGKVGILTSNDPQATRIGPVSDGIAVIKSYTLHSLTEMFLGKRRRWDLIKMDIEGAEFEVIMSMDRPYATQLSVEFHLHTKIYGQVEMRLMENKLEGLGYKTVSHEYTEMHGAGNNYWDSLFILQ